MNMGIVAGLIKALAPGVDPEVIEQAVTDWMDDHPEATTTVEDGSITEAKLAQDVLAELGEINELKEAITELDEQIEITDETPYEYYHNIENPVSIEVRGNGNAFGNVRLANRKNYLPQFGEQEKSNKGITVKFDGRFIKISGTATGTGSVYPNPSSIDADIPAGSYKLYLYMSGTYTQTGGNPYLAISGKDANGTSVYIKSAYLSTTSTSSVSNITISNDLKEFGVYFSITSGLDITDTFNVWIGLYPNDVTITDTGTTIADGETETFVISSNGYPNCIDSVQHEGSVTHHPTIQHYIDNKQINIDDELTYVTPEAFGAIGDGFADDSIPINNCITYAFHKGVSVRGYQKYKTTQPIQISGNGADIYIRYIEYTGTDYAVVYQGRRSVLQFGTIVSSGTGIYVNADSLNTEQNNITVCAITASKYGVSIYANKNNYDNKLFFNYIYAGAEYSCIYIDRNSESATGYVNEWFLQGGLLTNGLWGIKGYLGGDFHINVHTEGLGSDNSGGAVWCNNGSVPSIDYIRTGEIMNHNTVLKLSGEFRKSIIQPRAGSISTTLANIDISELTISASDRNSDNMQQSTNFTVLKSGENKNVILTRNLTFWGNRIQMPPARNMVCYVTDNIDMTVAGYDTVIPKKFVANTVSARIDLHPTYAANCLDSFIVKQDGYELVIYDFLGTKIFDGSDHGDGTFKVTAYINDDGPIKWDCSNQEWAIRKIED